jgi:thiol-disulfide isomerase/thioredoxin
MKGLVLALVFPVALCAQSVIKVTDLVKRLQAGNDTTYVLNFWATWCPPCVEELPELDQFGADHKGKLKVLLVSINYKEDLGTKLIPFLQQKNIRSEVCLLDENNFDYFPRQVDPEWNGDIPCTFVLNRQHNFREKYQRKVNALLLDERTKAAAEHRPPSIIKINDLTSRLNAPDTVYVVNFWATWCVPCVKELPEFSRLDSAFAGKKVKVLLVSMDFPEDYEKLMAFVSKKNIRQEVLLLDESNPNYFIPLLDNRWTGALPCTLVISRGKNVSQCFEKPITFELLAGQVSSILK